LAVLVHGRGRGLAWGIREVQGHHCALIWSERQREGVELEVGCLGFCEGKGKGREIGGTLEADWWGCGVVWVQVHAWRVVERKERGGRGS
jgi:hypothetical protein